MSETATDLWQPIETAPRDTWILICGDSSEDGRPPVGIARVREVIYEEWEWVNPKTKKLVETKSLEWEWDGSWVSPEKWMPLPLPYVPAGASS